MDGSNLRAVLLDLDDTAYAYVPCHRAGLAEAFSAAGTLDPRWSNQESFVADYEQARREGKVSGAPQASSHCRLLYFKRMTETRFGRTALAATQRLHEAYWRGYFSALKADRGCAELLGTLRVSGIRLAWVTNFTTERQMLKLQALGLSDAADFLVTSEEAGAEKPDPAPFRIALERLGVQPGQSCFIGDEIDSDYRAARALGMRAIWFNRKQAIVPKDVTESAQDWRELAELFSRLGTIQRRPAA